MYANHGMYPEEKILGNTFIVNVKAGIDYIRVTKLEQTIDYEIILNIVKEEFATAKPLLEELVYTIEQNVLIQYPSMKYFYLSIQKLNPPLGTEVESSEVSIERKY